MSDQNPHSESSQQMTVDDAIALAKKYNAGVIKLISRDEHDNVMGAVIVASKASAPEVLRCIEDLEREWEHEEDDTPKPHSMR